jgi:hypothetical protein
LIPAQPLSSSSSATAPVPARAETQLGRTYRARGPASGRAPCNNQRQQPAAVVTLDPTASAFARRSLPQSALRLRAYQCGGAERTPTPGTTSPSRAPCRRRPPPPRALRGGDGARGCRAGPATSSSRSSSRSSRPPCSSCGSCSPSATQRKEMGKRRRGRRMAPG